MSTSGQLALAGRPFRTILRYNKRYWKAYLLGSVLAMLFSLFSLAMPLVMQIVVDDFTNETMTRPKLWGYFSALIVLAGVVGILRYFERMIMIRASRKFEYDLRNDYFQKIQTLSQDFFHRTQTGEIIARATNDLNYVRALIGPGVMGTVDMLRLPFTMAFMIYLSGHLTLVSLIPLPFVSLMVYGFVMAMHHQSKRVQDQFGVVSSRAQENLAGARVVQAYGIADRELREFSRESRTYMRENFKLSMIMSFAWPIINLMVGATILVVLWRGGNMVIAETEVSRLTWNGGLIHETVVFSLGDLTAFLWCMLLLAWPLADFGWVLTLYQRGAVSMNRISDYLTLTPTIRDTDATDHSVSGIEGRIRFDDVSFSYDGREALGGIDFHVEPGHTLAIVGPTGSGKSTIVSLLTREYDPTKGSVLIDEMDARRIPLRVLRGAIGHVPQDTFLFSDTIRENMTLGRSGASDADVAEAADVAQLSDTIQSLPDGYQTLLGERGVNLSGGQKQRLAIARAIVRDPEILILDDALSSVDTHTEEEILQRLKEVMANRTSVIISHRVSTVRHADQIIVMEQGRIVERGTHAELTARGGLYAEMYERQLLEDALEDEA
ncbi:MAG: ABC transporter ATP-binding protein [Candidatus Hydrogenedentota bacterium]